VATKEDAQLFVTAAQEGDLGTLQSLLAEFNGMVNCFHNGVTALHAACVYDQKEAVEWLLDVGKADVEITDHGLFELRAIHWAVKVYILDNSSI